MGQYRENTVSVTNGSNIVNGNSTSFLTNVSVGDAFKISGENAVYTVNSIVSATRLTLNINYSGSTNSAAFYIITRDFTPNFDLYEVSTGDRDWPFLLTERTIRKIDEKLASIDTALVTNLNSHTVDNFHASQTATPNYILPLNANGRFVLGGSDDGSSKIQTDGVVKGTSFKTTAYSYQNGYINANTADGSDTGAFYINGGGGVASVERGSFISLYGLDHVTDPGKLLITAGNYSTAYVAIRTGNAVEHLRVNYSGRILAGVTLPSDDGVHDLQVNGPFSATGDITIGNSSATTTTVKHRGYTGAVVFQPTTTNATTQINLIPVGTGGIPSLALHQSPTLATGSQYLNIGTGTATVPAASAWNFGAMVVGQSNADSWPINFNISNTTHGRFTALSITNSGRILAGPTLPSDDGVNAFQVNGTIASKGIKLDGTASSNVNTLDYYQEGTFTATGVGFDGTAPTATWSYVRCGKMVAIAITEISGTSNATTFTVTGLPSDLIPSGYRAMPVRVKDNGGGQQWGEIVIGADGSVTFSLTPAGGAFTNSGTKAVSITSINYII